MFISAIIRIFLLTFFPFSSLKSVTFSFSQFQFDLIPYVFLHILLLLWLWFPFSLQTHHFLSKLFSQQLVLDALLLHLQALLVIVERQLLQGLENFLHLGLGRIVLGLQPAELRLHPLAVTAGWGQELRDAENSRIYTVNVYIMAVTISPPNPSVPPTNYWAAQSCLYHSYNHQAATVQCYKGLDCISFFVAFKEF